jgi:hypothetical protein
MSCTRPGRFRPSRGVQWPRDLDVADICPDLYKQNGKLGLFLAGQDVALASECRGGGKRELLQIIVRQLNALRSEEPYGVVNPWLSSPPMSSRYR